jgi:hypothetical protein
MGRHNESDPDGPAAGANTCAYALEAKTAGKELTLTIFKKNSSIP